jgi:hypothetical protein
VEFPGEFVDDPFVLLAALAEIPLFVRKQPIQCRVGLDGDVLLRTGGAL